MPNSLFDVVAIGNAIVDVLARAEDDLIAARGLAKGSMTLIDAAMADDLYGAMGAAIEASGGSAANTAAGIAALGGRAAFIGKVADDELGRIFRHDIKAVGVHYDTPALPRDSATPTARSMILITPDAERTMSTYLGACVTLCPEDIDEAIVKSARVTYVEGYLWDEPRAKEAIMKAILVAKDAGRKVALSLSDTFCVERHREEFQDLTEGFVDILFANEGEAVALYQSASVDEAVARLREAVPVVALTRGAAGSLIVTERDEIPVPAEPADRVVDTTGAGDLYAAGFLAAFARAPDLALDIDFSLCGRLAGLAASECIGHMGPRPERDLKALAAARLALSL